MMNNFKALIYLIFAFGLTSYARNIYVNNANGNNTFDGLASIHSKNKRGPVASIKRAFSIAKKSDHINVANTGIPYQGGNYISKKKGGTPGKPMIVDGNGATISGLGKIPPEKWKQIKKNIYSTTFWPWSNMLKRDKKIKSWIEAPKIWWLDGKTAPNCLSKAELDNTKGGFFWNKRKKEVWVHLPENKKIDDVNIMIPKYGTCIGILADYVVVKNFRGQFSLNDGFDASTSNGKSIIFKNCIATDNCGQGFSCHGTTQVLYEDCLATRCASSGTCDVNFSNTTYRRCIFANNTFEAGVYATEHSVHLYEDCLIVGNVPFEQIWQVEYSKMNFINCVILGENGNSNGILKLNNGSVFFYQCTIADAPFLCNISLHGCGNISVRNSIITRMRKPIVTVSREIDTKRLYMNYNVYWESPGIKREEVIYNAKNWNEYIKKFPRDKHSRWLNPNLTGNFNSEIPHNSPLHKMGMLYGRQRRIGADLPKSVWEMYFKECQKGSTKGNIN